MYEMHLPANYYWAEKLKLYCHEDFLTFGKGELLGMLGVTEMVLLQLEGDTTRSYFVPTTKRPFLAMCVGTFLESDPRAVEIPISREGLAGEYKISLIIDDKKYETGITVKL